MKGTVFFLGKSGVGKSTLMKGLAVLNDAYRKPRVVVTRSPRPHDDLDDYEYLAKDEFMHLCEVGQMAYSCGDGVRYYGYRQESLDEPSCILLLYGSPYAIEEMAKAKGCKILVVGNSMRGLRLRGASPEELRERVAINAELSKRFYSKAGFRSLMDATFANSFSNLEVLCSSLHELIHHTLEMK